MEAILWFVAAVAALCLWLKVKALENRCTYLEHLVGQRILDDAKRQPDSTEDADWWKRDKEDHDVF